MTAEPKTTGPAVRAAFVSCCGGREGPGEPFTPHYLASHRSGGIDLAATHARLPVSDVMAAIMLGQMHDDGGMPVFCGQQSGAWYCWDGTVYAAQDGLFASRLAQCFALAYSDVMKEIKQAVHTATSAGLRADAPQDDIDKQVAKAMELWGKHLTYLGKILNENGQAALIRQLGRTCGVDESLLDEGTGEIVVGNGRISYAQILRDRRVEALPQDSSRRVTRRAGKGVCYDPAAACPVFDQFLATSVADLGQRQWLLWRTVNALFGRMPRKGFLNLIGEHDSGKGTYLEIMSVLGGAYARTVPVKTFLAKHAGDAGFLEAELRGARMVCAQEPRPGARFDEGTMKTITGRDRQKTAGKYEKPIEWTPQCTAFIGSNGPIKFATSDEAMSGRLEAVRFARGYAEADPDLMEKLKGELPGILNRLLETVLQEAGWGKMPLPKSMVAEREAMADETEDALMYVREGLESGWLQEVSRTELPVSAYVPVNWLFQRYRIWCENTEGIRQPLGRKDFSAVVGRRYPRARSSVWRFSGLATQDQTALM